jgi:hypothetical protein
MNIGVKLLKLGPKFLLKSVERLDKSTNVTRMGIIKESTRLLSID